MINKFIAAIIALMFGLQGCTTQDKRQSSISNTSTSAGEDQICSPVVVGLIAAAGCALVAKDKNRIGTAAACAAAAAIGCYLINSYRTQQMRTAKQVEDEYLGHNQQLPERATVTTYTTDFSPSNVVTRGQKMNVTSTIVVVPGRSEKKVTVEEELKVLDSTGTQWGESKRKPANANGEAGEYKASFTIPVHSGMSQGVYTVHKTLYVNGAQVKTDNGGRFQVAAGENGMVIACVFADCFR